MVCRICEEDEQTENLNYHLREQHPVKYATLQHAMAISKAGSYHQTTIFGAVVTMKDGRAAPML